VHRHTIVTPSAEVLGASGSARYVSVNLT
jgi:hypothetical protein